MKQNFVFVLVITSVLSILSLAVGEDEATESPIQLRSLVEGYQQAKKRALDPLDRKFDAALLRLKRQFTEAGRPDDVWAVVAVIEKRKEARDPSKPLWRKTLWEWGSGGILELKSNGEATHTSWSRPGKWKLLEDGTVKLDSQHGESIIVRTGSKTATLSSSNGGRTTLRLIESDA